MALSRNKCTVGRTPTTWLSFLCAAANMCRTHQKDKWMRDSRAHLGMSSSLRWASPRSKQMLSMARWACSIMVPPGVSYTPRDFMPTKRLSTMSMRPMPLSPAIYTPALPYLRSSARVLCKRVWHHDAFISAILTSQQPSPSRCLLAFSCSAAAFKGSAACIKCQSMGARGGFKQMMISSPSSRLSLS